MTPRQEQLRKLLERTPDDAFLVYAMALEQRKAGELDAALATLGRVTVLDPKYAYAHFQRGQIYEGRDDAASARAAYAAGVEAAKLAGDRKGEGEIGAALAAVA